MFIIPLINGRSSWAAGASNWLRVLVPKCASHIGIRWQLSQGYWFDSIQYLHNSRQKYQIHSQPDLPLLHIRTVLCWTSLFQIAMSTYSPQSSFPVRYKGYHRRVICCIHKKAPFTLTDEKSKGRGGFWEKRVPDRAWRLVRTTPISNQKATDWKPHAYCSPPKIWGQPCLAWDPQPFIHFLRNW